MTTQDHKTRTGVVYALLAFTFWGLAPIYFKWVAYINPLEVLSHRVLWSVVMLLAVILLTRDWPLLIQVSKDRHKCRILFVTAVLVAINWLTFIYAVATDRILDTALGYYTNPLVNVLLGFVFLGERLRKWQLLAIVLAALGVINEFIMVGRIPWIAMTLAITFGFYGLLRKKAAVQPIVGLTMETLLLLPFALGFLVWMSATGSLMFLNIDNKTNLLLLSAGIVTSLPLLWFAAAANRLSLTAIGIAQYLAPSISFLMAVFFYDEVLHTGKIITFSCIWLAIVIFTGEGVRRQHLARKLDQ